MINPGVITLASLQNIEYSNFPYRFDIEDNIGEAIHIHFKDVRLDLTVEEFCNLAEEMYGLIDDIVGVEGFSSRDFDPVILVGISSGLPKLKKIIYRKIHLEDIQVDTFDENGNPIFASLSQSRVFKSLNGIDDENDKHTIQFNYYQDNETEKVSNKDRVLYNLSMIKEHGYPHNNELIGIDSNNRIWDGQHRASCLYYLYGNIEVPVRELVYGETEEYERIKKACIKEEYELYLQEVQSENSKVESNTEHISFWRRFLYKFLWQTVNQAELSRHEMRVRLENIEKMIREKDN